MVENLLTSLLEAPIYVLNPKLNTLILLLLNQYSIVSK